MDVNVIGDGEHSHVVHDALFGAPKYGHHVAFVGKPGTTHRREFIEGMKEAPLTIIHKSAIISESATIGAGCYVGAGAIVQPGAVLGQHCVINTGAIVEHNCVLGDGVVMAPRAVLGGGVKVGPWAYICMGACVRDHLTIGERAIVGMGAVVVKDVAPFVTVMGVPAK